MESALQEHVSILCESERNTTNCPEGLDRGKDYLQAEFNGKHYAKRLLTES